MKWFSLGLVVACGLAFNLGCATEEEREDTEQSESRYIAFEVAAVEADGPQGGCSNAQIRHCAQKLCEGTVDACYDTPDTAEYYCHCRNGGVWTGIDNLVGRY